jgi:transcriptional regulator NrdR family protein
MTTVIKRNGSKQPFDVGKIQTSIVAASDSTQSEINASDIGFLAKEISGVLSGKDEVTSHQIYYVTVGVLYGTGFQDLARTYTSHSGNAWK